MCNFFLSVLINWNSSRLTQTESLCLEECVVVILPALSLNVTSLFCRLLLVTIPLSVVPLSSESLEVHSAFTWVGQTKYKLQLKAQEVLCLALQACFLQAGVYNLSTPRVYARVAQQAAVCESSQQTASPALIIITNAWAGTDPTAARKEPVCRGLASAQLSKHTINLLLRCSVLDSRNGNTNQ